MVAGRSGTSNPEGVIENTMLLDLEAGLPLDYDHATEWDAFAPAAGWLKKFEVRDGAIWAHCEWTDKGRQAVASREYQYISPVFRWNDRTGEVMQILRAGLTNNPNLFSTAICGKEERLVISVAIPITSPKGVSMPTVNKEIASMFSPGAERAILAREGVSEPFPEDRGDSSEPDSERGTKGFQPIFDGRTGGRRAEPVSGVDPAIERDGLAPARLDGEGDEIAEATQHLLAGRDHDNEGGAEDVCSGPDCDVDHVRAAHDLLARKLSLREAIPMMRFQR